MLQLDSMNLFVKERAWFNPITQGMAILIANTSTTFHRGEILENEKDARSPQWSRQLGTPRIQRMCDAMMQMHMHEMERKHNKGVIYIYETKKIHLFNTTF